MWEKPTGFALKGPNEVRMIMEKLEKMIISEGHMSTLNTRNIFKNKPGFYLYNNLSGDIFLITQGRRNVVCCK